jgi:hypothetical protein
MFVAKAGLTVLIMVTILALYYWTTFSFPERHIINGYNRWLQIINISICLEYKEGGASAELKTYIAYNTTKLMTFYASGTHIKTDEWVEGFFSVSNGGIL